MRFLDNKAFNPVLQRSKDDFSGQGVEKFEDVKRSTENEKKRFHDRYHSAKEVRDNYLSDLNSKTAKRKNSELKELGLPILPELKDEFLQMCDNLDVH